jgi:hypothetical protein
LDAAAIPTTLMPQNGNSDRFHHMANLEELHSRHREKPELAIVVMGVLSKIAETPKTFPSPSVEAG